MRTEKKAFIFDLDGTLADSLWVWSEVDIKYLGEKGCAVPEDLQGKIEGMSFTETAEYFKERFSLPETVEEIKETWIRMAMEQYATDVPLKKGAKEFLLQAKAQGIRLGVASSNHIELIRAVLEHHAVRDCFDCIVTSCEVAKGKPAPDVYLRAAELLETAPKDCVVFEDIVPGILAGKNAGMKTIAIADAYSRSQEAEKRELADGFLESYEELLGEVWL